MSPFVRTTYISVFTTLLVYLLYCWWVFQVMGVGYFMGPDALVRVGKTIGGLIVFGHLFEWAVLFSVVLVSAKFSGKSLNELVVDERDKQINHRSVAISRHVLCLGLFLGLFLAIGALAVDFEPFWVFNIMVLGYAMSNLTELSAKIFFFRQGIRA